MVLRALNCQRIVQTYCSRATARTSGSMSEDAVSSKMENVHNFRDLTSAYAGIKAGVIYRCASPVKASESEMRVLRSELGVTTLVDLRSAEEIEEFGHAPILAGATFVEHKRASSGLSGWLFSSPKMEEHVQVLAGNAEHQPFTIHHLSILNKKRFYVALAQRLPPKTIAHALVASLWGTQASSDLIMDQVNKGGLLWLYEILLDTSALEFGTALKVIKTTLEGGGRVMIYCKAGKDRTGLLVMLLLHIAGASEDEILDDYHRSDSYHKMALGGLEKKEELKKLDTEVFSKAPKAAMHHALTHIRKRYGTVDEYLVACGFSSEEQRSLRSLLTSR